MNWGSIIGGGIGMATGPLGGFIGAGVGNHVAGGGGKSQDQIDKDNAYQNYQNHYMDTAPKAPGYVSGWNKNMSLYPQIKGDLDAIQPNTQGLDKYRSEALRTGPSAWAGLATDKQNQEETQGRSRGAAEAAGQTAGAQSNLAMRGGITSGARERIASTGAKNYMDMSQNLQTQGDTNRMQIGMNDEQNRISQLGALPGMENQALEPAFKKLTMKGQAIQGDNAAQAGEAGTQNAFNMQNYATQGGIWGAGQQAAQDDPRNPNGAHYDDGKRWYNPFSW